MRCSLEILFLLYKSHRRTVTHMFNCKLLCCKIVTSTKRETLTTVLTFQSGQITKRRVVCLECPSLHVFEPLPCDRDWGGRRCWNKDGLR
jgi:hypothetical protein